MDATRERGYADGGFRIFDISDKAKPKLIKHQKTFGFGVHRFDVDENYAYMSTEMEGYIGNILVIYDVKDPSNPTEVSRVGTYQVNNWPVARNRPGIAIKTDSITRSGSAMKCGRRSGMPVSG